MTTQPARFSGASTLHAVKSMWHEFYCNQPPPTKAGPRHCCLVHIMAAAPIALKVLLLLVIAAILITVQAGILAVAIVVGLGRWVVKKVPQDTARASQLAEAMVKGILGFWGFMMAIVVIMATVAMLARNGFIAYGPEISRHAKFWAALINYYQIGFDLIVDAVKVFVNALEHLIKWIGIPIHIHQPHFMKFYPVSATEIRRFVENVTVTCANVTSPGELLTIAAQLTVGPKLCPVLRAAEPLGVVRNVLNATVGWMSTPAAPEHGNCAPLATSGQPGTECLYLGAGVLLMDVLLPLVMVLFLVAVVNEVRR